MCTLAIYFQISREYPVVIAANRDEFYRRPASPPVPLAGDPWIVAGHDLTAGGTWFGVNGAEVAAGILNRRSPQPPDPARRSRGQLCLEVLGAASVSTAAARLQRDDPQRYNPFNLLLASPQSAHVAGNFSGTMRVTGLSPGLHLLTNLELNDFECPRIAKSYALFEEARRWLSGATLDAFIAQLRRILSDHSTPLDPRDPRPPNNLCVHTPQFGTRSSTILIYTAAHRHYRMWHADGPPCVTPYAAVVLPQSKNNAGHG